MPEYNLATRYPVLWLSTPVTVPVPCTLHPASALGHAALVMKEKQIFEAVVTVQGARLRAPSLSSPRAGPRDNPLVDLMVMVPKGDKDVTVPTNCKTTLKRRTFAPIWNESFAIPVLPSSDVLVFRVHMDPNNDDERRLVGVCLLPVAQFDAKGNVSRHTLEIFSSPNEAHVGHLFVAAKVRRTTIELLEKEDLALPSLRKKYYSGKLSGVTGRFLGIGELAAFLYEEGYSDKIDENWDRALHLLAEQLAYRIYATTDSPDDDANFQCAWDHVEKEGGLWDGV